MAKLNEYVRFIRSGQEIASFEINTANRFLSRFLGLMGRKAMRSDGLWLSPCNSVHTCVMRFPIDVVFLDANGAIISTRQALRPWRFALQKEAKSVLELKAGEVHRAGLKAGDVLRWKRR